MTTDSLATFDLTRLQPEHLTAALEIPYDTAQQWLQDPTAIPSDRHAELIALVGGDDPAHDPPRPAPAPVPPSPAAQRPSTKRAGRPRKAPTGLRPDRSALAAARVALSDPATRRFLADMAGLKKSDDDEDGTPEHAARLALAVLGLSDATRHVLHQLDELRSADPVTVGVTLGRADRSTLAEMHRIACLLTGAPQTPLPAADQAIRQLAADIAQLTDEAVARAAIVTELGT